MSAFSFNTAYQPTGDQQKDAIAQIDIMQNRAVQANLAYQSSLDAETLLKQLWQINDELGELLDSVENHTPVIRKKASDLSALMMLFSQQAGQPMTMLLICYDNQGQEIKRKMLCPGFAATGTVAPPLSRCGLRRLPKLNR